MRTRKPTVYLETSVVSMLFYRGDKVADLARHMATREWWEEERRNFDVYASEACEAELFQGNYPWRRLALQFVRRLPYLPQTRGVTTCLRIYLKERIAPETKMGDAAQLAFATAHKMDYLMTWNCAHLANTGTQARLGELCRRMNWRCPLLVTPDTIPRARFGQAVARRHSHV
jgi:hypothetical protein